MTTHYEMTIPESVRSHAADLLATWRADGRPDDRIVNIVHSVVLAAYSQGLVDGSGPFDYS